MKLLRANFIFPSSCSDLRVNVRFLSLATFQIIIEVREALVISTKKEKQSLWWGVLNRERKWVYMLMTKCSISNYWINTHCLVTVCLVEGRPMAKTREQWPPRLRLPLSLLVLEEKAQCSCDSQARRWQSESCFHRHASLLHPCGPTGCIFLESEPHGENALSTSVSLLYWLGAWPSGTLPLFSLILCSSPPCLLFPSQSLLVTVQKTSTYYHPLPETDVRVVEVVQDVRLFLWEM